MKNKYSKGRMAVILVLVAIIWGAIIVRLVDIQIVHGSEYGQKAQAQSSGKLCIAAERGLIYDRTGREVALNILKNSLYAYPQNSREIKKIYGYVDRLFGWKSGTSRRRYSLQSKRFTWIRRNLSDNLAASVSADSIPGLYLRPELIRDHPFNNTGRQLLGNTDIDGLGIAGLEFAYDSILAGSPGYIDYVRDGKNNTYCIKEIPVVEPVSGKSIVLTIDWYFQELVEKELKAAVEKYHARSGTAVFLDCNSGEILAAADYVDNSESDFIKLRSVSDCFEPGSVLKVVTASALLDEDLIDLEEKIFCENGVWKCGRRRLHDDKKYDSLTLGQIVELSSNIGIGKLAQRLGGEKLIAALRRFGFGQRTRIDLPGEAAGSIGDPGVWSDYNIAALAMGHSIMVTPLQLAGAMAAVANGGSLYRPRVVRAVLDNDGGAFVKYGRELIGRVIDEEDIEIMHDFLAGVVERGTATPVKSDIVTIAGKTGTAEIPDNENGGYHKNEYNASFAGYFPAENPRVAGVVVLERPKPVHYGGYTAGPAFRNIAESYTITHADNMLPDTRIKAAGSRREMLKVASLVGCEFSLAEKIAEREGLELGTNSKEGMIIWQYPPPHRNIPGSEKVIVLVREKDDDPSMVDLTGVSMRTAIAVMDYQGVEYSIEGSGRVVKQYPAAGTDLKKNTRCRIICDRG